MHVCASMHACAQIQRPESMYALSVALSIHLRQDLSLNLGLAFSYIC